MLNPRCITAVLLSSGALGATPLAGQVIAGHAGIRGRISNADGRPLPGATVVRAGGLDTVRTDSLGRYLIERLALGRHVFVVQSPGYDPIEMEVTFPNDTTITVDIPLQPARVVSPARLEQVGFLARRRRPTRGATFLGPDEIAARAATRTSSLFEGVPDITMRRDGSIFVVYGYDQRCVMNVWVNGLPVHNVFPPQTSSSGGMTPVLGGVAAGRIPTSTPAPPALLRATGLDDVIQVGDIAAIEIYPWPSRTPPEFHSTWRAQEGRQFETRSAECGAIVIWSRAG